MGTQPAEDSNSEADKGARQRAPFVRRCLVKLPIFPPGHSRHEKDVTVRQRLVRGAWSESAHGRSSSIFKCHAAAQMYGINEPVRPGCEIHRAAAGRDRIDGVLDVLLRIRTVCGDSK